MSISSRVFETRGRNAHEFYHGPVILGPRVTPTDQPAHVNCAGIRKRPGRGRAEQTRIDAQKCRKNWAGRLGAEFTCKKLRVFSRAGRSVLTATHFFHGHFFKDHTAHIFFDKFSRAGWAGKKESQSENGVTPLWRHT